MIITTEMARAENVDQKDLWATPDHIFKPLNDQYQFTLDPACVIETAKCEKFFTPAEDGLTQQWKKETVFVNPPYSRGNIDNWMRKCYVEAFYGTKIVALIPVSTSANWFHQWVYNKCRLYFYKGRIKFEGAEHTAPFSSMLAIYNL